MSYIFRDGIMDWETDISTTSVKKSTDWIYSTKAKTMGSSKKIKRTIDKGIGVQPANGSYIEDNYSLPNGFNNKELVFFINQYTDTDINSDNYKIECKQGIWNNTEALFDRNIKNTFIMNENIDSVNRETETPWLVVGGFETNIPETATVTSVQVKIERSSFSFNDSYFSPLYPNVFQTFYLPTADSKMLDENITTYTRDSIITLHDKFDEESSIDNLFFENKSQYFKKENIEVETTGFSYNNVSSELVMSNLSKTLSDYDKPFGIWSKQKETVVYGDSGSDTWGTDDDKLTSLVNGDFCVKLKIKQKIFKGYGYKTFYNFDLLKSHSNVSVSGTSPKKLNWGMWTTTGVYGDWLSLIKSEYPYKIINTQNSTESHYYHRNSISMFDISIPLASYVLSRIYSVSVKVFYEERPEGFKTIFNSRSFVDNNNLLLKSNDIYFKNQKCFDGVCYNFINSLDDIYKKSLITGDGYCINNMYNEYNIIDKYSKNVYYSDICYPYNVDITIPHTEIDVKLVSGMRILLYGQDIASQNGVYVVDNNYMLIYETLLYNREKSERAKFYIDYGSGKGKQFFLLPNSDQLFPNDNEPKIFEEGKSYILKNLIKYNIYNTSSKYLNKILFTDYSVPRSIIPDIENLFSPLDINISTLSTEISIQYKECSINYRKLYNYIIKTQVNGTIGSTFIENCDTFITEPDFYNKTLIGDYVRLNFHIGTIPEDSNQILTLCTTVKNKLSGYRIQISDIISSYHNDYIISNPEWIYTIINMNCLRNTAVMYDIISNFNCLPFGDVMTATDISEFVLRLSPKKNNFKYLNYNDFEIKFNGGSYTFLTENQMVNYTLKSFLDKLLLSIGTDISIENVYNSEFLNSNEFTFVYTEINGNGNFIITPNEEYKYKLQYFKKYTYVEVSDGIDISKSLILDINDTSITIERPKLDGAPVISSGFYVLNINSLTDISEILFDVYMNFTNSYYNKLDDSMRNLICESYIGILKNNSVIRNIVSGMIYQENGEWNYDIYNLKIDSNFNNKFDTNMTYYPLEILELSNDNKTKLQKQLDISNFTSINETFDIIKGYSYRRGTISNKSFIQSSLYNYGDVYYLGGWSSGLRGTNFVNDFSFSRNYIFEDNKAISLINKKDGVLYDMKFINITQGERTIYGEKITYNNGIYCVSGNISDTSNLAQYNFNIGANLADGTDIAIVLCSGSSSASYQPKSSAFLYSFDIGGTFNEIEIFSDFTDIDMNLTDSNNIEGLSLCGNYNCKSNNSVGMIRYNHFETTYKNKNNGFVFNFNYDKTLSFGFDIIGSFFYKTLFKKDYVIVVGKYDNSGISRRLFRDQSGYSLSPQVTNNSNINSLFICKMGKFEVYGKMFFEIPLYYKYVTKVSDILEDGDYFYFSFINENPELQRKENVIMKFDFNGNIIWDKYFINNASEDNEITICQDSDNIYLSNIYDNKLEINDIKFDTPNNETYSYIIVIDKNDGGIKNGINLVSSEYISVTSIIIHDSYLNIAGNFKGSILINIIPLKSVSEEYYITKLKKEDILW